MSITVPFSGIPNTPLPPPQKPQKKTTNHKKITVHHPDEGTTRNGREIILTFYIDKIDVEKLTELAKKGIHMGIPNNWDTLEVAIDLFNAMDPSSIIDTIEEIESKKE